MISRERFCKYCGATIVMIKVSLNKTVPCNAEAVTYWESAAGTTSIVTPNGETLKADLQCNSRGEAAIGYIAHRSVCPHFIKGASDKAQKHELEAIKQHEAKHPYTRVVSNYDKEETI